MTNKELVTKYYKMWNEKDFSQADILCDENIKFRGSLDITTNGIEELKEYAQMITQALSNPYHAVEMLVVEGNTVAAYVTYTGKHEGKLFDYEATNKRIAYSGASFFQIKNSKIVSVNILGDLNSLLKQLSE